MDDPWPILLVVVQAPPTHQLDRYAGHNGNRRASEIRPRQEEMHDRRLEAPDQRIEPRCAETDAECSERRLLAGFPKAGRRTDFDACGFKHPFTAAPLREA